MISTKNSLSFMNICTLVTISTTENDYGETAQTETSTDVFCAEISIHSARKDSARVQGYGLRNALSLIRTSTTTNCMLSMATFYTLYTIYICVLTVIPKLY